MLQKASPIGGITQEYGKHFDLQGSGNSYCLIDGHLVKTFQTLYWATIMIPEDQGLHKSIEDGRWEVYGI